MRSAALALGGLAVASLAVSPLWADNTDTQNVSMSGTIIAPLVISATGLVMPHLVRPAAGEAIAQVTLTCDPISDASNTVAYINRSNPFANGVSTASNPNPLSKNVSVSGAVSTGTCAAITVTGQPSYNFIAQAGAVTATADPAVTFSQISCTEASVGSFPAATAQPIQLSAGGTSLIRCGGVTKATNASVATTYSASFPFTVTYD